MSHRKPPGFTFLEMLIVTALALAAFGILLQVLRTAKRNASLQYEGSDLHRLQAAFASYGTTNKGWYPGLMSNGQYPLTPFIGKFYYAGSTITDANTGAGATVHRANSYALAVLLETEEIPPELLIASTESGLTTHLAPSALVPATPNTDSPTAGGGPAHGEVTRLNFSYALLQYAVPELKPAWKADAGPRALVASTRLIFTAGASAAAPGRFSSLWTKPGSGKWKGAQVCGDGSVNLADFDAASVASASDTPFGDLKYDAIQFTPLGHDTASVGVFGKSGTGMRNFGANADKGQLGSAND